MKEIQGKAKTVRELLKGEKYSIDYYQREYKWQEKQMQELIEDLCGSFLADYKPSHERAKVADYGQYFLGSIILSRKDGVTYIVDGQQRLTSLTLLIVYLRNSQPSASMESNIDELIFSSKYGKKSFNLAVPERDACMQALFDGNAFDATEEAESLQNVVARFSDIANYFPSEIDEKAMPYFIDWLMENVRLVEITAFNDEDAYTIFETMNDRGLSLTPEEMLKGYLLANVRQTDQRDKANALWKQRIAQLSQVDEELGADFFKAWLRSQYATKIRERKKGAKAEDFDLIGTQFHRWLRDQHEAIGLKNDAAFFRFITTDFDFYCRQYLKIWKAMNELTPGLESVCYVADYGFTLQPMLLLAPLCPDDEEDEIATKIRLVADFLDVLLARRLWNFRSIAYSTMQYAMFLVMRDIRGLDAKKLKQALFKHLQAEKETFQSNDRLRLHQQNRNAIHCLLARLTDAVEVGAGQPSRYDELVNGSSKIRYEVEHIWADKPERHKDEFNHPIDFAEYRNRIGALLLLPKSFNASYGALTYEKKLPHYLTQNLLARSLHTQCYQHNPGFKKLMKESGLAFQPHPQFRKADIEERSQLYQSLADFIWNPDNLLK